MRLIELAQPARPAGDALGKFLGNAGRAIGAELARPEKRAFWAAWAATIIVCGRRGMPGVAALLFAELAGAGAMKAYQASEHLAALAAAARTEPADGAH